MTGDGRGTDVRCVGTPVIFLIDRVGFWGETDIPSKWWASKLGLGGRERVNGPLSTMIFTHASLNSIVLLIELNVISAGWGWEMR